MLQGCDTVRVTEATEDLLQRYVSMYIYTHVSCLCDGMRACLFEGVDVFVHARSTCTYMHVEVVVVVVVVVHDVMLSQ